MFDALPDHLPRVVSIGRLDFNTEGLLLLTNDGALARHMELPATGWMRRYRVRAHGAVDQPPSTGSRAASRSRVSAMARSRPRSTSRKAATCGSHSACARARTARCATILESLSLTVNRLIRISFGPFQLQDLALGEVEAVKRRVLIEQLGPRAASELGIAEF